jgi:ATP-dependent Clp protease ATP-binding subunit ClpA
VIPEAQAWAANEARELEDGYIGTEHFLLGLARGASVASEALRACGVTYERLRELHLLRREEHEKEFPRPVGLSPNPRAYTLMGRMDGFAAAAGAAAVRPEHVLLALLWDPDAAGLVREAGTTRADVKRALGDRGVAVPAQDPPPDDHRPRGKRVFIPVERLDDVLREMRRRIPKGDVIGFNYYPPDRAKAWVVAGADFDLEGLVDEVLARG